MRNRLRSRGRTLDRLAAGIWPSFLVALIALPNHLRAEWGDGPTTIKRMTSEAAYEKARSGKFAFSFSSDDQDAVANKECHLFQGRTELTIGGQ